MWQVETCPLRLAVVVLPPRRSSPTTSGSSRRASARRSARRSGSRFASGQNFRGDPVPRDAGVDREVRRSSRAPGEKRRRRQLRARPGGTSRGSPSPGTSSSATGADRSRSRSPPEKFEEYLKEEGLEKVIAAARAARRVAEAGEGDLLALREVAPRRGRRRRDRLRPRARTPARARRRRRARRRSAADARCRCGSLFEGKPLAGALVVAINREDPEKRCRRGPTGPAASRFACAARASGSSRPCTWSPAPAGVRRRLGEPLGFLTFEVP